MKTRKEKAAKIEKGAINTSLKQEQKDVLTMRFDRLLKCLEKGYITDGDLYKLIVKAKKDAISHEYWMKCDLKLFDAMLEVRPFDISTMFYYFNKSEDAANQVKDQNIVLLLGNTGSGLYFCFVFLFVFIIFFV